MSKIKSSWMGGTDASPQTYRASSQGKVFTRKEKVAIILGQKNAAQVKAERHALIQEFRKDLIPASAIAAKSYESNR